MAHPSVVDLSASDKHPSLHYTGKGLDRMEMNLATTTFLIASLSKTGSTAMAMSPEIWRAKSLCGVQEVV